MLELKKKKNLYQIVFSFKFSSSCEEPTSMISVWLLSVQACCGGVRVVIITKGFGGCPVRSFGKSLAANKKKAKS